LDIEEKVVVGTRVRFQARVLDDDVAGENAVFADSVVDDADFAVVSSLLEANLALVVCLSGRGALSLG
jgi:hypothetical protein